MLLIPSPSHNFHFSEFHTDFHRHDGLARSTYMDKRKDIPRMMQYNPKYRTIKSQEYWSSAESETRSNPPIDSTQLYVTNELPPMEHNLAAL
jgi:hypothetical protein